MEQHENILEETRRLEQQCGVASSPPARALKARLRAMPLEMQVLHLSAYVSEDQENVARCVLAVGALTPDTFMRCGTVPMLSFAAGCGSVRCLRLFLDAGANVRRADAEGNLPPHTACAEGRAERQPGGELLLTPMRGGRLAAPRGFVRGDA